VTNSQSVSQSVSPGFVPPRGLMNRFCSNSDGCGFVRHGESSLMGGQVSSNGSQCLSVFDVIFFLIIYKGVFQSFQTGRLEQEPLGSVVSLFCGPV
jgi:hypothetical protein